MKNTSAEAIHQWSRRIPVDDAGLWAARLSRAPVPPHVITEKAGGKTALASVCATDRRCLLPLVQLFGGSIRKLEPREWLGSQNRDFVLHVGRQLAVASEGARVREDCPVLRIPAGMAFGTGEHATTAMCLRQLAEVLVRLRKRPGTQSPGQTRVIDAGTGSGILALAAAMLGARVEAFDFDPLCLEVCRANGKRNPTVPRVKWARADVLRYRPKAPADVLVANLFAGLLERALPRMKTWLKPGGILILSGILREQQDGVLRSLARAGVDSPRILRKGKWICLVASRNPKA